MDAIILKVSNRGSPIAPEALRSVFEPLTQLQNSREPDERSQTSMGLGLFIVREIVNGHSGAVTVESSLEDGTVFTVKLPKSPRKWATHGASRRCLSAQADSGLTFGSKTIILRPCATAKGGDMSSISWSGTDPYVL